ncbi:helix-turn-helix domain-containing protein [Bacillus sp. EAC]|uniref:helix-turn-helix domain-containing protein n=1 Tax=Bacillus sp. EAC TaxID=1978338 RepID=UPI000B444EEE|nr:helix-turn-helix transcriptional regulator [Bacillus sp. EAC]
MLVGEIIKFYREKKGISQSKLGEGICCKAYISRFEGGKVILSPEIISKLSERLGIDINKEIEALHIIELRLKDWNQAMIMQNSIKIEEIKLELENMPFIMTSKHSSYYLLLTARYYLHNKMFNEAKSITEYAEKNFRTISDFEKNLILHIKGMYCISTYRTTTSEDFRTAVRILKQINIEEYKNEEFYYHLALGYHYAREKVLAYSYANKALNFFNNTYNYMNAINAQILMLMQFEGEKEIDLVEIVGSYKDLIHNCESLGAIEKKLILLNNLGVEFFKRGEYKQAAQYIEQSLLRTDSSSIYYLRRFYNFVETCSEGKLLNREKLLEEIVKGAKLAKKQNSPIYITLFKLLLLKCKKNRSQYYECLAKEAIPQFVSIKNESYIEQYGKKLYTYYIELEELKKAIELNQYLRSECNIVLN